jgi:hypothetical protein
MNSSQMIHANRLATTISRWPKTSQEKSEDQAMEERQFKDGPQTCKPGAAGLLCLL